MEGTFDPEEGLEGRIQRTILLWMGTFHPKEALVHMEEGWMLAEEGLFHPEEPSFLLWMAIMLPKEGTFLPGEGAGLIEEGTVLVFQPPFLLIQPRGLVLQSPFHSEEGWMLTIYQSVPLRQGIDLLQMWKTLSAGRSAHNEQNLAESRQRFIAGSTTRLHVRASLLPVRMADSMCLLSGSRLAACFPANYCNNGSANNRLDLLLLTRILRARFTALPAVWLSTRWKSPLGTTVSTFLLQ